MIVATFSSGTGWAGRSITWDDGVFSLEGHGPISANDVLNYEEQGQLDWPDSNMRAWVYRMAGIPEPVPGVRSHDYSGAAQYADVNRLPSPPGIAIAGFILAIVGLIFPLLVFWWVGLGLSWAGYRQAVRESLPTGLALAGLIINAVMTVLSALFLLLIIGLAAAS